MSRLLTCCQSFVGGDIVRHLYFVGFKVDGRNRIQSLEVYALDPLRNFSLCYEFHKEARPGPEGNSSWGEGVAGLFHFHHSIASLSLTQGWSDGWVGLKLKCFLLMCVGENACRVCDSQIGAVGMLLRHRPGVLPVWSICSRTIHLLDLGSYQGCVCTSARMYSCILPSQCCCTSDFHRFPGLYALPRVLIHILYGATAALFLFCCCCRLM